ncbi:MAG: hypothetical protein NC548_54740 [Lachnospiraceae bacterium]|nr:hypothetical protein [Lachnospiraceae bacterium]
MKYYSFIMLKPDAIRRGLVANIVNSFIETGYTIEVFDYQIANSEKIHKHYSEKIEIEGESFKVKSTNTFEGKPVIPIIISSNDKETIKNVRKFIGATDPSKADPDTIRGRWAMDSMDISEKENRCCENLIHASDSIDSFIKEINIWFNTGLLSRFTKQ